VNSQTDSKKVEKTAGAFERSVEKGWGKNSGAINKSFDVGVISSAVGIASPARSRAQRKVLPGFLRSRFDWIVYRIAKAGVRLAAERRRSWLLLLTLWDCARMPLPLERASDLLAVSKEKHASPCLARICGGLSMRKE